MTSFYCKLKATNIKLNTVSIVLQDTTDCFITNASLDLQDRCSRFQLNCELNLLCIQRKFYLLEDAEEIYYIKLRGIVEPAQKNICDNYSKQLNSY